MRPDDGLRPKLLSLFVLIFEYTFLTDSMRLQFLIITLMFLNSFISRGGCYRGGNKHALTVKYSHRARSMFQP